MPEPAMGFAKDLLCLAVRDSTLILAESEQLIQPEFAAFDQGRDLFASCLCPFLPVPIVNDHAMQMLVLLGNFENFCQQGPV